VSTSHGKSLTHRGTDTLGLLVVFGVLWAAAHFAPKNVGGAALIGALGFLLLAGTLLSDLLGALGLPHLTGYLLAGTLAGPHVLHLIDHRTVGRLAPVNTLALAMIALEGGAHLKIDALKRGMKSLALATLAQNVLGVLLVGGVFFGLHSRIDFTRSLPLTAAIACALLWGVASTARSPSAALGVLSQTRARGPLAQYTLGFVMMSDVVIVVLLASAITVARPLVDPSVSLTTEAFSALGHELLGSIAIGTTLGVVLAIYLRLIGKQLLVLLVALGFGATEVLGYLHYDALLTFIVAGMVVQNLSKQGEKLLHGIEQAGAVVYVVFFASAGAHLNVPLLRALWPIALVLCGSRILATFCAARLASRLAHDEPVVKRWAWAPLISQAGFALGIAQIAGRAFPQFGKGFGDLAIATIAMNEIVGPILFKLALDRAGETRTPNRTFDHADEPAPAHR
jgi:Kef-type K+ transport system membrane component KefB